MAKRCSPIAVVGFVGPDCFGAAARDAVRAATVVVGSDRQLRLADPPAAAAQIVTRADLPAVFDELDTHRRAGARVAVLASGDPGFFGIVRALAARFGSSTLRVHPAPSTVALAFARLGCSWDDAVVVSAHGRTRDDALVRLLAAGKAAVLTSPDNPPEAIGAALVAAGCPPRRVAVLTHLGDAGERRFDGDLDQLAAGRFDPMSVVVLLPDDEPPAPATVGWGLPEDRFAHRDGMITKAEVRAVTLSKLALPPRGVLWDIGAGSGSVAIEAKRLRPGLRVVAVERDADSVARIAANAAAHDVEVETVHGTAPAALNGCPDPDRVFVGGGGLSTLDAALARLRPDGVAVANYALLDRAVAGWARLGHLVEVAVARGAPLGDGVHLRAEHPVFVCWGPE